MAEMCEFVEKSGKKFLYKVEYEGKEEVWPFDHEQVLTYCPFYDDEIPVDAGLSDFLVFLWSLGLVTTNSCERQPKGHALYPNATWFEFEGYDGVFFLNLLSKSYHNKLEHYKVKDWIAPPPCWVSGGCGGMSVRFDADRLEEVFTNMRDYAAEMGVL